LIQVILNILKRGEWTKEEDLKILAFVIQNGTRWSKLTKQFPKRTEHNLKNRFFGILSKHLSLSIKKIKRSINYRDEKFVNEVMREQLAIKNEPIIS